MTQLIIYFSDYLLIHTVTRVRLDSSGGTAAASGLQRLRTDTTTLLTPVSLTLIPRAAPHRRRYLDYLAHVGDNTGKVSMGHIYHSGARPPPSRRTTSAEQRRRAWGA